MPPTKKHHVDRGGGTCTGSETGRHYVRRPPPPHATIKRLIFLFIFNEFMQPLGCIYMLLGIFSYFLRYLFAHKFAPNGNLQNDKSQSYIYHGRKQKICFLIKVI